MRSKLTEIEDTMSQTKSACKWLAALGLVAVCEVGCRDDVSESGPCYPPLSEIYSPSFGGHTYWGCAEYKGEYAPGDVVPPSDEVPEGIGTEEFIYCLDLEPGQACDGCLLDDMEELVRDAYVRAKECEAPVSNNVGGCSHVVPAGDGYYEECCTAADCEQIIYAYSPGCAYTEEESGQCCYMVAIASPCTGRHIY